MVSWPIDRHGAARDTRSVRKLNGKVYHAARGFLHHLQTEVSEPVRVDGDLLSDWTDDPETRREPGRPDGKNAAGERRRVYWTRNVWEEPFLLEFESISEAANALRALQRNWAPCPTRLHRRIALITERLPPLPSKPKKFPFLVPDSPMGAFTLLDDHTLMGSARCSSPFPNGEFEFVEDKEGPPSRAYRKLWEALMLAGTMPGPGDRCLDAGASPGGWTWAIAGLGASVHAVDRAPLAPSVASMPGVSWERHDAFTLKPQDIGPVDWLFSDVICYPDALYAWISSWLESGMARNFICTIKMQGADFDRETTDRFAGIPGSRVLHLWHNRHELTWMRLQQPSGF